MRLLDLGCGSGAAAYYLASKSRVEIVAVTNSAAQADICRRKFAAFDGRVRVILADFDRLDLADETFNAIYRRLPFGAWGMTWNFIKHLLLWKFRLRMRTMVGLEKIIWRTSKIFVFGNAYNIGLARKPGESSPAPIPSA